MTATGNVGAVGTQAGGLSGLTGITPGAAVGGENPEWDFPYGKDRVSQEVQKYFFRGDAGPTGINAAEPPTPQAIDEFRRLVNTGVIRPKNQAASNIVRSQGGLRAGDETLLGPIIDGMPEGLTPEYWQVVIQRAQQVAQEQIAIMNSTGYFNGVPTLDRQRIEADIANNIARTEIERRLADNTIRSTDLDEAYRRDEMAQNMRQNIIQQFGYDPGPQGAAGIMSGNPQAQQTPIPGSPEAMAVQQGQVVNTQGQGAIPGSTGAQQGTPTGASGTLGGAATSNNATAPGMTLAASNQVGWQYVPGSGWMQTVGGRQQTLAEQQQAWQQQADVAKAASNPRDYIYAQMLGGARGGLAGQAPTNQMTATTPMPGQPGQMMWPRPPESPMLGQPGTGLTPQPGMPQWGAQPGMAGMPGQPGAPNDGMVGGPTDGMMYAQDMIGGMPREQWNVQNLPGMDMAAIAARKAAGQTYMGSPMPEGPQMLLEQAQVMPQAGQTMGPQQRLNQMGFQAPGTAGQGMWGAAQRPGAGPGGMGAPGQTGQMPGMRWGQMGQPQQLAVGAFSTALNKNRLVPGSGAMGTQGQFRTMDQIRAETNPMQWRTQDFMRGNASERQQALGTASAAGFSDEDTQDMLKKGLPSFSAPSAGRMI